MRIDRPAEDDTPRSRPESHAADTPSAAGREPPNRVACAAEYRATVDATYHDYQAAREWDEAVPPLREAWETHEKKWTYPERSGPTVHPDIPGAWRGDGGRYLAPGIWAAVIDEHDSGASYGAIRDYIQACRLAGSAVGLGQHRGGHADRYAYPVSEDEARTQIVMTGARP